MSARHCHDRVAWAVAREAESVVLAAAQQAAARAALLSRPCTCEHPAGDHDGEDGCLHGWGQPPAVGCFCEAAPVGARMRRDET